MLKSHRHIKPCDSGRKEIWDEISLWVQMWSVGMKALVVVCFVLHALPMSAQDKWMHCDLWKEPLEDVIHRIEKTFGKTILYANDEVRGYRVTVKMNACTAEDAVGAALHGKPFIYSGNENYITISSSKPECEHAMIAGIVVGTKREPLPYARIEITSLADDRRFAVATDKFGQFRISNEGSREFALKASFVGRKPYTVVIKNPEPETELGFLMLQDSVIELPDVLVTPEGRVVHADRYVVYPSQDEYGEQRSGIDIVEELLRPGSDISVTEVVLTEEKFAQLNVRINGRKATLYEVRALRSEDIMYVEYLYNELLYGNRPYAVNLITKNRYGFSGEIEVGAQGMPDAGWSAKAYSGSFVSLYMQTVLPSYTWGLHYQMRATRNGALRWDEDRAATLAGLLMKCEHDIKVNGNVLLGEKQNLQLSVSDRIVVEPGSRIERTGGEVFKRDGHGNELSAKAEYTADMGGGHTLTADLCGRMYFVRENYSYVDGEGAERFATGYRQREDIRMIKADAGYKWNFLSEKRWNGSVGVDVAFHGYGDNTYLKVLPQFLLRFVPAKNTGVTYCMGTYATSPEMLALSDLLRPIDRRRSWSGNRELHPATVWKQKLGIELGKNEFVYGVSLNYEYMTNPHTLHTMSVAGEDRWVYMWTNGGYASDFYPEIGAHVQLAGKRLQLRLGYGWHRLAVSGRRTFYNKVEAELFGLAGHWKYGAVVNTSQRILRDETEIRMPDNNHVYVGYTWHNLRVGASWMHPFSNCGEKKEIIRRSSVEYTRNVISYGRQGGDVWLNLIWSFP